MLNICRNFIVLILLLSIHTEGSSQIIASKTSGCAPLTVQFTAPSSMSTYYWDFDNGGSSTDANPSGVIFATPKDPYTVSLRACKTCPILHTINISVYPKPTVQVVGAKGCTPLSVDLAPSFTLPTGVQITSVRYLYGDGNSQTYAAPNYSPVSHSYTGGDNSYPVTFELTTSPNSAGCDHSITVSDLVKTSTLSILGIAMAPDQDCTAPFDVTFSAYISNTQSIVSYDWDFGDGGTSNQEFPSHKYATADTYTVALKVKDAYGCEKTYSQQIEVKENNTTKILSKDTVCINSNVALDIDGNVYLSALWNSPGSTYGTSAISRPYTVNYNSIGLKNISVTSYYTGYICPKTFNKNIYVIDPIPNIKVNVSPLCKLNNTAQLECLNSQLFDSVVWYIYDIKNSTSKKIAKGFNTVASFNLFPIDTIDWKSAEYVIEALGYSKYGCTKLAIGPDTIKNLVAHIVPTATLGCVPLRVGFYDKTLRYRNDILVEWTLIYGDGTQEIVTSFPDTVYHTYTQRGVYNMKMIVKNKYGCLDTTYITKIEVGKKYDPSFTITTSGNMCASDTNFKVSLQSNMSSDSVQQTQFWVEGFQCSPQSSITYHPNKNVGNIPIIMEVSDRGCYSADTQFITVKGPIARISDTQYCDSPRKVVFSNLSQDATSYLWDFGDGTTFTDTNPTHYYTNDGFYDVKMIAYNASAVCPPDTSILNIQIQTPSAILKEDSFLFCHYNSNNQFISASQSSGYIDDGDNTGLVWEFANRPPFRTFIDSFNYNSNVQIIDTVYLSVRNFMNCVSKDTAIIIVEKLFSNITVLPTIVCPKDTVKFKGDTQSLFPITKWVWKFGTGDSALVGDTSYVYDFPYTRVNPFIYSLEIEDSIGCKFSSSATISIKHLFLDFLQRDKNYCFDTPSTIVRLIDDLGVDDTVITKWVFPNNIIKTGDTVDYNIQFSGTIPISIYTQSVSNPHCVDTLHSQIYSKLKPNYYILSDKDTNTTLCNPVNIDLYFSDTNHTILQGNYTWEVINSSGTHNFSNIPIVSTPLEIGNNKITFIAQNTFGCSDTTVRNFIVKDPKGEVEIDKNNICKGDEITFTVKNLVDVTDYYIDFGDGSISTNVSPVKHRYTYVPLGGKTVAKAIFAVNVNECVAQPVDTIIHIYEVFAKFGLNFNNNIPLCFSPIHIKDSSLGADKYDWDFGDGSFGTMSEPGYRNFPTADTYFIQLSTENSQYGCKDTFRDTLVLLPIPKSYPINDTVCLGDTARVYQTIVQSNTVYYWEPIIQFINNPKDTQYLKLDSSLTYTSIAVDTSVNCSDTATGLIKVIRPINPVYIDTILSPGQDFQLPFVQNSEYTYRWNTDSFFNCHNCDNPVAEYILNPIEYIVNYTDIFKHCFDDSSVYKIRLYPDILVNAPKAFTPNGDGINDIYYARGFGIKKMIAFKIFNRWGQLLFYSVSEDNGWDGYYKGEVQNSDVYYYTIEAESYIKDKIVTKTGNFMLLK